jgi:cytochrome c biogenesis protein
MRNCWNFFASVKLAIVIFALISLISIIGTIVEQQAEPDKNISLLAKFFGDSSAPTIYNIFAKLGFIDMYRSRWYIALLFILALNITICSFDRLPRILRIIKDSLGPLGTEQIERLSIKRSILLNGKPEELKDTVRIALKRAGFNAKVIKEYNGYQFYSQKGLWSRLGVYVTHLSILVIMLGAIAGMLFSVESFISLPEGDISSVTYPIPG